MALQASVEKRTFQFGFTAKTSRGTMQERTSWLLFIREDGAAGIGEAAPLPGLSHDATPEYEAMLSGFIDQFNKLNIGMTDYEANLDSVGTLLQKIPGVLRHSSVAFAFETALLDLRNGGTRTIFDNGFVKGTPIPINGLIWMGGMDFMLQQIEIKIREGFTCIKMKVGGINFEKECDILQYLRRKYFRENITLRLDANGAFREEDVNYRLNELSRYDVHSIEQPLRKGSAGLAALCETSPVPVALDEELIGVFTTAEKERLLDRIRPAYVVLKPSLHGGLASCREWIRLAEQRSIGWWITSALESSIGLNAIAQFTANYPITIPQGLGTGQIYTNNIESPLMVRNGQLNYGQSACWSV